MQQFASWLQARLDREASTRAVGLMRIGLALILWSRWANELLPFRDLSPWWLALSVSFYVCTTWMLIGWYGRAATAATAVVIGILVFGVGRVGGHEDWVHHHTTLLAYATAWLALTPNSTSLSVDRWLAVRRAEREGEPPEPERGPVWAVDLLALQVSTVYLWSAYDKTSYGFLAGYRLEQIFVEVWWGSDLWTGPLVRGVFCAMAVSVVAIEYILPFALWFPRTHWLLFPIGFVLHGLFYVLLPVNTFTVTMCLLYLSYVDPEVVHRSIDRLLGVETPR